MEPLQPSDPREVGPYRLHGRLGSGGMGQVYFGRSPGGRPVAVKVIHEQVAQRPNFPRRFAREVDAARRVGGFHTAQVIDADPDARPPWLVTAYVSGPSLQQAVQTHGPLPLDTLLTLGAGLAEGLAAVHACGLVHRDLKPSNVILAPDGPRIIDFGIVHAVDASTMTAAGAYLGTPAYSSPEQARGDSDIGPAGDVFAFGCVLAFAASGRSPFEAPSLAAVVNRILNERPDLSAVPEPLRELVDACLAKDAAERPALSSVLESLTRRLGAMSGLDTGEWLPPAVASMDTEEPLAGRQPARGEQAVPGGAAQQAVVAGLPEPIGAPPTAPDAPGPASVSPTRAGDHSGGSSALAATLPAGPARPARSRRSLRVLAFAGIPVLLLASGVAWWRLSPGDDRPGQATAEGVAPPSAQQEPVAAAPSPSAASAKPSVRGSAKPSASSSARRRDGRKPASGAPAVRDEWTHCRSWATSSWAEVPLRPCIRANGGKLDYILHVRGPAAGSTTVSVWVWVVGDGPTKYQASLRKCRMTLSSGDSATCGPYSFTPPAQGRYGAAAGAHTADGELPPGWTQPTAGLQGPAIAWPS